MSQSAEDRMMELSNLMLVQTAELAAACALWVAKNSKAKIAVDLLMSSSALVVIAIEDDPREIVVQAKHIRGIALAHEKNIILTVGTAANRLIDTTEQFISLFQQVG